MSKIWILAALLLTAKRPADGAAPQNATTRIEIAVTEKGIEPAEIRLKKGRPVTLIITRQASRTCAREIVIDEYGIDAALPLNMPVSITFTPRKAGRLKYGCRMHKMVSAVLIIE